MRLQNNNIEPYKQHHGVAQRQSSYINEVKATNIYPTKTKAAIVASGVAEITNVIAKAANNCEQKAKQIEAINKTNEWNNDYKTLTENYMFDYTRNPDDSINLTKQYENNLKTLQQKYEKQIPENYQQGFSKIVNDTYNTNNLDLFRKKTDLEFQTKKFMDSMNDTIERTQTDTYNGNYMPWNQALLDITTLEQQTKDILGNYNGERYLKQYKSNLIKGNISAMVNTNPESALYNLEVIQKDDRFKDTLTPKELNTLKTEAKTRKEAIDEWNKTKEMAEHFTKTNLIFNQIQTGELTNYDDIVNALMDSNTDEYTSRYLLKQAGYSGELPPDLKEHIEELKIIEKETNRNILNNLNNNINNRKGNNSNANNNTNDTNNNQYDKIDFSKSDKDQIKNMLTNRVLALYQYIDPEANKEIKEESNKRYSKRDREKLENFNSILEENYDKIKDIQSQIYQALDNDAITKAEAESLFDIIQPYANSILSTYTENEFRDKGGFWKWKYDIGKQELDDAINNILANRGLPLNREELKNNSRAEKEYYRISNNLLQNYMDSANYLFIREKQNRPDKYRGVNSWLDFTKEMDKDKRKEFYDEALRMSLDAFANGINVDQNERNISRDRNRRPLTREESIEVINNYYNDIMALETIELINE